MILLAVSIATWYSRTTQIFLPHKKSANLDVMKEVKGGKIVTSSNSVGEDEDEVEDNASRN